MSLQLAKSRRLDALQKRNSDRMLVAPVNDPADLRLPDTQSVAAHLIGAVGKGVTIEQLIAQTEWPKPRLMANLYRVAKKTGVGIRRSNQRLHVVWPEGFQTKSSDDDTVLNGEVLTEAEYTRVAI